MWHGLSFRLGLSHILPILIIVPLLGIALLYQLERRFIFDEVVDELTAQGLQFAELTGDKAEIWQDATAAAAILQHLHTRTPTRLLLADHQGKVLATSGGDDRPQIGQIITDSVVLSALQGQIHWAIDYSPGLHEEAIDVAVPVRDPQGGVIGLVRLSHGLPEIQQRLVPLRWIVLVTLFIGAGLAFVLGLILARSLSKPIVELTKATAQLQLSTPPSALPEVGPQELKVLAATFNTLLRRLYELRRTRQLLLSGIIHELSRPLGSIKMAAHAIQSNQDVALHNELAIGIDEQVEQLRLHIDDLALYGQLELQAFVLNREPLELPTIVAQQCRQFRHLVEQKELTLTNRVTPPLPAIDGDAKWLAQIVGNLLHNAYKYTPPGGQVTLAAQIEASSNLLTLTITDTGPGISPEEQEKIFTLFYRNPQQRRIHQGMGIGLALSRYLAEAHGGTLTVQSPPGQGATFCLSLPLAATNPHI